MKEDGQFVSAVREAADKYESGEIDASHILILFRERSDNSRHPPNDLSWEQRGVSRDRKEVAAMLRTLADKYGDIWEIDLPAKVHECLFLPFSVCSKVT